MDAQVDSLKDVSPDVSNRVHGNCAMLTVVVESPNHHVSFVVQTGAVTFDCLQREHSSGDFSMLSPREALSTHFCK